MNARNRNLILVTNQLDAVSYYVVATVRLLLSDPLFFLIGYWYGDTALTWMEQRTKTYGSMLRQWERWFHKAAYPLVFIAPNNVICLFAGRGGHERPRLLHHQRDRHDRPAVPDPAPRARRSSGRSTTSSTSSRATGSRSWSSRSRSSP